MKSYEKKIIKAVWTLCYSNVVVFLIEVGSGLVDFNKVLMFFFSITCHQVKFNIWF